MNPQQTKKISRFLSLVLRHQPHKIGIVLDDAGWTSVSALLTQLKNAGHAVSLEVLETVVAENDKQRFQFSEDRTLIRAKQKRHPVHLHVDQNLAASVGQRRGRAVVLTIDTKRMEADGYEFFVSPNSVWLTDHVPPEYITFPHTAGSPAPAGLDAAP